MAQGRAHPRRLRQGSDPERVAADLEDLERVLAELGPSSDGGSGRRHPEARDTPDGSLAGWVLRGGVAGSLARGQHFRHHTKQLVKIAGLSSTRTYKRRSFSAMSDP